MLQLHGLSVQAKMMIDHVLRIRERGPGSEELKQMLGIIAAVSNPFAPKDLLSVDVGSVNRRIGSIRTLDEFDYLLPQLRRHSLIGVESDHPFGIDRESGQRPLPLPGMGLK